MKILCFIILSPLACHSQVCNMLQRVRGCVFPLLICLVVAAIMVGMWLLYSFRGAAFTLSEIKSAVMLQIAESNTKTKPSTEPDTQNSGAGSRQGPACTHNMVHALGSITNSLYPEPAANCSSLVAGNSTEVIRIRNS